MKDNQLFKIKSLVKFAIVPFIIIMITIMMHYSANIFFGTISLVNTVIFPMCVKPIHTTYLATDKIIGNEIYKTGRACSNCYYGNCNESSIIGKINSTDKVRLLYLEAGQEGAYRSFKIKVNDKLIGYIPYTGDQYIDRIKLGYDYDTLHMFKQRTRLFCF